MTPIRCEVRQPARTPPYLIWLGPDWPFRSGASPFSRTPDHVFDHGWPMPIGAPPPIFLAPVGELPQAPGNRPPGASRPFSCREKLGGARRNPKRAPVSEAAPIR